VSDLSKLIGMGRVPGRTEVTSRGGKVVQPAAPRRVRVMGPIEGHRMVSDPAVLDAAAADLMAAADWLRSGRRSD
jgi:hypothetical protein